MALCCLGEVDISFFVMASGSNAVDVLLGVEPSLLVLFIGP